MSQGSPSAGMSRKGLLLFAAMSVIWGIPYLLIKVALEELTPSFLVFARTAIAAAVLLPLALRRGIVRPALAYWRPMLAFAVLEIALPWFLVGDAERHMPSSLAGLLIATVPLIGALVAWRLGDASAVSGTRLLGLVVGIAGVAAVVGLDLGAGTTAWPVIEILLVSVGYATAPIIASRKLSDVPTLAVIAVSLTGVAVAYAPAAVFARPHSWPKPNVVGAVLALALVCTALAFLLFFALIAEVGPVRATVITFVNPAVAVALGVTVLDEPFTLGIAVGFPLVLLGSWLATRRPRDATAPAPPPAQPAEPAEPAQPAQPAQP
jgi:drug/metabolite transporter (DMT)-like permease